VCFYRRECDHVASLAVGGSIFWFYRCGAGRLCRTWLEKPFDHAVPGGVPDRCAVSADSCLGVVECRVAGPPGWLARAGHRWRAVRPGNPVVFRQSVPDHAGRFEPGTGYAAGRCAVSLRLVVPGCGRLAATHAVSRTTGRGLVGPRDRARMSSLFQTVGVTACVSC